VSGNCHDSHCGSDTVMSAVITVSGNCHDSHCGSDTVISAVMTVSGPSVAGRCLLPSVLAAVTDSNIKIYISLLPVCETSCSQLLKLENL